MVKRNILFEILSILIRIWRWFRRSGLSQSDRLASPPRVLQKRRATPAAIQQKWCGVYFCRPASKSRAGYLPY